MGFQEDKGQPKKCISCPRVAKTSGSDDEITRSMNTNEVTIISGTLNRMSAGELICLRAKLVWLHKKLYVAIVKMCRSN